jgi:hypothetical protein
MPTGIALVALALLLVALPSTAVAQAQTLTLTLSPQNNSGISGTATFTDTGNGKTHVVLQASGAGAGPEPAHIHPGSCATLDPTPAYTLSSVVNGMSTTDVDATLQQLVDGQYAIHMHKSPDELTTYVACADILRTAQPRALPNTGNLADDWMGPVAIAVGLGLVALGLGARRRAHGANRRAE